MLETHAPIGGASLYGRRYAAGEFEPFYVPRQFMPQIDGADFDALLAFATAHGVAWQRRTFDPATIEFHQRVDVNRAMAMAPELFAKPILCSIEPYVLDGNHRLYAHKQRHIPVQAICFDLHWAPALSFLFTFPKTYTFATVANPNLERN